MKTREAKEDCDGGDDSEPFVPCPLRGEEEGSGVENLTIDALRGLESETACYWNKE